MAASHAFSYFWGASRILTMIAIGLIFRQSAIADTMPILRLDYSAANPLSLVIKSKHWVEDAIGPDMKVEWNWMDSSREVLNSLDVRGLDIGSASAVSAFMARSAGVRVKIIYVTVHSSGSAIVVRADSQLSTLADIKGLRVAVPRASEARLYLLTALATQGLTSSDLTIVPLSADNGRVSLDRHEVDAWVTQEPDISAAEAEVGDKVLYRNPSLMTDQVLVVRESFLKDHADLVEKLVRCYEQARSWVAQNPTELAKLLAFSSEVSPAVAARGLSHDNFTDPVVGDMLRQSLTDIGTILTTMGQLPEDTPISTLEDQLLESKFTASLH